MAIVVVGGQTKNVGKTSVVAGLIAALPEMQWTAFKITQDEYGAGGKSVGSEGAFAVSEERVGAAGSDSARFLAAGAVRSFWVRGALAEAMPRIREELARAENAVIESNSILRFLEPDLYLSVLDPAVEDFKGSARYFLDRADAVLVPEGALLQLAGVPVLTMRPPVYVTAEVVEFVLQGIGNRE
jgi:hypothetical protein